MDITLGWNIIPLIITILCIIPMLAPSKGGYGPNLMGLVYPVVILIAWLGYWSVLHFLGVE